MASGKTRFIFFIVITLLVVGAVLGAMMSTGLWNNNEDKILSEAVAGQSSPEDQSTEVWFKRCSKEAPAECEIFQRLVMKENNMRLVEVAVVPLKNDEGIRMAVILPLGIAVHKGIALQVDSNPQENVPIQSCNQNGCYTLVNLPPAFLESMERGSILNVGFLADAPNPVKIEMSLKNFRERMAEIK